MSYPTGAIQVTGGIGTTDSSDTYATHYSELGRGGLKSTQDTTSRNAIPSDRREFGMEVTLLDSGVKYRLCNEDMGGVDNDKTNNSNWIEVITSIDPSNYDLTDFTNISIDPFVKLSEVVTSVDGDSGDVTTEYNILPGGYSSIGTLSKPKTIYIFDSISSSGTINIPDPNGQEGKIVKIVGKTPTEYTITIGITGSLTGKILTPTGVVDTITHKTNGYILTFISDGSYWRVEDIKDTPNLQAVTDKGYHTSNPINIGGTEVSPNLELGEDGTITATSQIEGQIISVATSDYRGKIHSTNITEDRNYELPDKHGTVALLDDILSDAVDIDYDNISSGLTATNEQDAIDEIVTKITCVQRTGSEIAFDVSAVYCTPTTPCTGNITYDFTDAKFDMVQTMFHEDTTVPTFGVGQVISGEYEVGLLNVITFRRLSNSEVFIKIQQITV